MLDCTKIYNTMVKSAPTVKATLKPVLLVKVNTCVVARTHIKAGKNSPSHLLKTC